MIDIDLDRKQVKQINKKLGDMKHKTPVILSRAINRAATNAQKNMSTQTRAKYHIKAGDIKNTISIKKASKGNLSAEVKSKGGKIGLHKFKVNPRNPSPKRKAKTKVAVKKGGLKPLIKAFVANLNGVKVAEREGIKRLPIKMLYGPSVPEMINNEETVNYVEDEAMKMIDKRIQHEIGRILGR